MPLFSKLSNPFTKPPFAKPPTMPQSQYPQWGRVRLKPLLDLTGTEWRVMYQFFRDPELAQWNGASPIQLPQWLFRRMMLDEEHSKERHGFGVLNEQGRLIGSVELYDLHPMAPATARIATLGIMVGDKSVWGQGYGRDTLQALLQWAFVQRSPALRRIRLSTLAHNHRAQRSFALCGFREIGRTPRKHYTEVNMELTTDEWQALFGNKAPVQ